MAEAIPKLSRAAQQPHWPREWPRVRGHAPRADLQHAAQLVDDQGRQRFAFDVLCDDQQRLVALLELLELALFFFRKQMSLKTRKYRLKNRNRGKVFQTLKNLR